MLRKYHYLNYDLSPSAKCYGLYEQNKIIGFCSIIHYPHPKNPRIKHIHRLVIHPDYQGIGLGKKLLNIVSSYWSEKKFDVFLVTSAKNLIIGLKRDKNWACTRYGKMGINTGNVPELNKTSSKNRRTATFKYIKKEENE